MRATPTVKSGWELKKLAGAGASKYLVSSKYYLYVRNKEKKEMEGEENVSNIVL